MRIVSHRHAKEAVLPLPLAVARHHAILQRAVLLRHRVFIHHAVCLPPVVAHPLVCLPFAQKVVAHHALPRHRVEAKQA